MDDYSAQAILQPADPPSSAPADALRASPPEMPAASEECEPAARPGDPLIDFAYACLRREYASLLEHTPRRAEVPAPENVHKLRIATRRLRTALRLFRRVLPAKKAASLRKQLRWLARSLSEVRDLDVYVESFRVYAETLPREQLPDLSGYDSHLRGARAEARSSLRALFAEQRYADLLDSFAAFLDGAPSPAAVRRWDAARIDGRFEKRVRKSAKRVQKLGRKIGRRVQAKKLHKLRIRTKRLRYELEFFSAVHPALESTAKEAKTLQDVLGAHQDACTASARLERYLRSPPDHGQPAGAPAALEQLLESQQRKAREARRAFVAEWRRFESNIARTSLAA